MTDTPKSTLTPDVNLERLDNLFCVRDKRVFIPGGYGAIGEATAWGFARHGARVAIAGPNEAKAQALAKNIGETGADAISVSLDAGSVDSIEAATDTVVREMGGIDILVNCVGIQQEQSLMDVTEEVFDDVYRVNLKSAMFLAKAVARDQIAREEGGRQIHLLSVRSQLALRGRGYSAYCATKGGLAMLVKQHAMELAPHNITVNGVAPTFIQSDRIRDHLERKQFRDFILERNPLGRIGDPSDVVGQIMLCSAPAGNYMTGQIVCVDGGVTASQ